MGRLFTLFVVLSVYPLPCVVGQDPPRIPFVKSVNATYPQGTVTEVTKDSITVQQPGMVPKRFPVSEVLAGGKIPSEPRPTGRPGQPYRVHDSDMYRLTDVKVGDWVLIKYAEVDGIHVCDHICIDKRPGGLIPPLPPGVKEVSAIPYHDRMNAYWNLEDNGIAYPAHFHFRRFPIAPPPREKK